MNVMGKSVCVLAVLSVSALSFGAEANDYSAEKRCIHEQVTGQKLDENGRPVREKALAEVTAGSRARLLAASSPLKVSNVRMSQRKDSKWVDVYYDLTGGNGTLCNVSVEMCDDATCITARTFDGDGIGESVRPGTGKHFAWNAGADWPNNFSKKVNATITATETDLSMDWQSIYIKWGSYGGRDLDICGYWVETRTDNVGWSWGSGSQTGAYQSYWHGDNTGSGPEQVDVRISQEELSREFKKRRYRVHFNYFGERGSPCKATVSVGSLSKTSSTSQRLGTRAITSDPCLTITFDEYGKPISID